MNVIVLFGTLVVSTVTSAFAPPAEYVLSPVSDQAISVSVIETAVARQDLLIDEEEIIQEFGPPEMPAAPEANTDDAFVPGTIPTRAPTPLVLALTPPSPTATPPPPHSRPQPTTKQPLPTQIPGPSPTAGVATLVSTGTTSPSPANSLSSDKILSLINTHRETKGLTKMEMEVKLCALAQSRGPELYNEIFVTRNVHAGFYSRKLPYWITENMAHYGSEETIVKWWLGSKIHRNAIEGDYKYSCGTCFGNSCAQLFTNYTPK